MWSSAMPAPPTAIRRSAHVVGAAPSLWMAKYIAESTWLLHITPIRSPRKATTEEMSSGSRLLAPARGSTNGVPQDASFPFVAFTKTFEPCAQVAHKTPVKSLSRVSVSLEKLLIWAGNPASSVYVWVAEL